jgi:hypothetical protein
MKIQSKQEAKQTTVIIEGEGDVEMQITEV